MSILYPVAESAEAALHSPRGFAARERGARDLAGAEVAFVTEAVGPAFETEAAALGAYAGRIDGPGSAVPPEARWCALRPVRPDATKPKRPVKPLMKNGRRWPAPDPAAAAALWRLSVSYWRIGGAAVEQAMEPARRLRKEKAGERLDPRALRALADQPLRAVRPQQALDIGLFEARLPENPSVVVPDD